MTWCKWHTCRGSNQQGMVRPQRYEASFLTWLSIMCGNIFINWCDRFLCHVPHQTKLWWLWIWTEHIVKIISICSHYLAKQYEEMWEDKLQTGLKLHAWLVSAVHSQACRAFWSASLFIVCCILWNHSSFTNVHGFALDCCWRCDRNS